MAEADAKPMQAVTWEIGAEKGQAWIKFLTAGANPLTIPMDPQAAFEMGENLARAAHMARFGEPLQSDMNYLQSQIRARVTEDFRMFLVQRISMVFNSTRFNKKWSNGKLAGEVVDLVLTKVA